MRLRILTFLLARVWRHRVALDVMALRPWKKRVLLALLGYMVYKLTIDFELQRAHRRATRFGPRWLGTFFLALLKSWSTLVGVRLASDGGLGLSALDHSRRYLIVWHPHGFIAWAAAFFLGQYAVEGRPHGREWYAMIAPVLFRIPFFGEALSLANGRGVDKKIVENLLSKGASIAIQPGGVKEQLITRHDQEQAVFPANMGFIRMAMRYGLDLLPVYVFGENQTYARVHGLESISNTIFKLTGFSIPIMKCKWGLPGPFFILFPKATDIHVRWGVPVPTGLPQPYPSDAAVEEVFHRYLANLRTVFHKHAYECLPQDVAAKGLHVIRLDGKPVPPHVQASTLSLSSISKM